MSRPCTLSRCLNQLRSARIAAVYPDEVFIPTTVRICPEAKLNTPVSIYGYFCPGKVNST